MTFEIYTRIGVFQVKTIWIYWFKKYSNHFFGVFWGQTFIIIL